MYENIKGDIYGPVKYLPISLFSNKIRIGIIGGGRAALIKTRGFYEKGCTVELIALEFLDEFYDFSDDRIIITKGYYNKSFIFDKHIIIITVNDSDLVEEIMKDCNNQCKIFINSSSFKDGLGVIPVGRETESLSISVNTKEGNPKAAVFAAEYAKESLKELDEYIKFTSKIRNNINASKEAKKELLEFIHSEDYRYFYNKHKDILVLKMFFDEHIIEDIKDLNKSED
jgi:precorrin-2 dehydrogenase/sirohydrochlorin ferrochelatase